MRRPCRSMSPMWLHTVLLNKQGVKRAAYIAPKTFAGMQVTHVVLFDVLPYHHGYWLCALITNQMVPEDVVSMTSE